MLVVYCWDPFCSTRHLFWWSMPDCLSIPVGNILNIIFAPNHNLFYTSTRVQTLVYNLPNILIAMTLRKFEPSMSQTELGSYGCSSAYMSVSWDPHLLSYAYHKYGCYPRFIHLPFPIILLVTGTVYPALRHLCIQTLPPPPPPLSSLCVPASPSSTPPHIFFLSKSYCNVSAKNP